MKNKIILIIITVSIMFLSSCDLELPHLEGKIINKYSEEEYKQPCMVDIGGIFVPVGGGNSTEYYFEIKTKDGEIITFEVAKNIYKKYQINDYYNEKEVD